VAKSSSMASDHSVKGLPPRLHTNWVTPHSTARASLRATSSGVPMTYRSRTRAGGRSDAVDQRACSRGVGQDQDVG
jgi:hypothetical protein